MPARSVGNRRWWSHGALYSACVRERPLKARDRTRVCIRADSWVAEEEPRQKGGKRKGKKRWEGGKRREGERRGRKLENDECGVREGVGDTSVCISAAKLPFEAGGKEDTGEKRGRPADGGEGEKEERVREEKEREVEG